MRRTNQLYALLQAEAREISARVHHKVQEEIYLVRHLPKNTKDDDQLLLRIYSLDLKTITYFQAQDVSKHGTLKETIGSNGFVCTRKKNQKRIQQNRIKISGFRIILW